MTSIIALTTSQLNSILALKEQIENLQSQIESIAAGDDSPIPAAAGENRRSAAAKARWAKVKRGAAKRGRKAGRKLSAAGRAAISAGAKARWANWAKTRGQAAKPKAVKKKDRRSSPAAKARWAKVKAEGKTTL